MIKTITFREKEIKFYNDVNIIIGSNGSGKTSLLELIEDKRRHYTDSTYNFSYVYITNDIINYSQMMVERLLKTYEEKGEVDTSWLEFKSEEEVEELLTFIPQLLNQYPNHLKRRFYGGLDGNYHYLTLLLSLYLNRKKEVILVDDIELLLDINQQRSLISILKKDIIPSSQLICTTNSPTIYYQGWIDKLIRLEDRF